MQQLHETQVEQDFNHVLLRGLGYTTQSDVASDQPWTLTPKWNVPGSGEVDAALGKFRLDESGHLSGEPLVMVELKGAKIDLDRKMPTRNITPVQQVWNYLNASESAQWAIVCNRWRPGAPEATQVGRLRDMVKSCVLRSSGGGLLPGTVDENDPLHDLGQ